MPNYIKNRIEIIGDLEQINSLVEKFSTFHPSEQRTTYDGDKTFVNEQGEYGWLNEESNIFRRRNDNDVPGVPDGFSPSMEDEFTRFPDFNKIIPMPESLSIDSNSWIMPLENRFSEHEAFKSHLNKFRDFLFANPDRKEKEIDNFITGVKNYIEYGHATWYSWSLENWGTKWNSCQCKKESENVFTFETAWSGVLNLIIEISKQLPSVKIKYDYADEDTGSNVGSFLLCDGQVIDSLKPENRSKEAYDIAFRLRPDYKERYILVGDDYVYNDED